MYVRLTSTDERADVHAGVYHCVVVIVSVQYPVVHGEIHCNQTLVTSNKKIAFKSVFSYFTTRIDNYSERILIQHYKKQLSSKINRDRKIDG